MPPALRKALLLINHYLDIVQCKIAAIIIWLVLAMTLTVCIVVVTRFFNIGTIALQESITYMHASVFMLCLAYTAHRGGHVRVDIRYRTLNAHQKAWVNLIGSCLFMLPFAAFLLFITWHSAVQSWAILERSTNPGGLPLVFVLKSLPPAAGILLCMHAISDIAKQLVAVSCFDHAPNDLDDIKP